MSAASAEGSFISRVSPSSKIFFHFRFFSHNFSQTKQSSSLAHRKTNPNPPIQFRKQNSPRNNDPKTITQTGKTRRVRPESLPCRLEEHNLHKESAEDAISTPITSAMASLKEAPAEGKRPNWSAASLAAPAKRDNIDPTRIEWVRINEYRETDAEAEKKKVRVRQKSTW